LLLFSKQKRDQQAQAQGFGGYDCPEKGWVGESAP